MILAATPQLHTLQHIPEGLLDIEAGDLWQVLQGPTLIHLPGRRPRPLFVSVLMHGNEATGLEAIKLLLKRYQQRVLPRALSIFIGNVDAARAGVRTLASQHDFNRVWPGTPTPQAAEAVVMREVVQQMAALRPFASIDIHNNTGRNPHYSCVNHLRAENLHLALLFSRTVVYFTRPLGTQSAALSELCPAITVECGQSGIDANRDAAAQLVDAALHLAQLPAHAPPRQDYDLLETVAIVKIPPAASFSFDGSAADFRLRSDIESLNFSPLAAGTVIGHRRPGCTLRLEEVLGDDVRGEGEHLHYDDDEIRLVNAAVPTMLTVSPAAVRLDCLCYLMRYLSLDA